MFDCSKGSGILKNDQKSKTLLAPIKAKTEGWHKDLIRYLRHVHKDVTEEESRTKRKIGEK